jgi:hypothetical protein
LEQRVVTLEMEVAELKRGTPTRPALPNVWEKLAQRSPMIRKWVENSVLTPEQIAKYRKGLGIENIQPLGAEKLQQMLIAEGHDPTSTETSRMLIEMREE